MREVLKELFDREYKPLVSYKQKWAQRYWEDVMSKYNGTKYTQVQVLVKFRGIKNVYPQFETEVRCGLFIIIGRTGEDEEWKLFDCFCKNMGNLELRERTDLEAIIEIYDEFEKEIENIFEEEEKDKVILC